MKFLLKTFFGSLVLAFLFSLFMVIETSRSDSFHKAEIFQETFETVLQSDIFELTAYEVGPVSCGKWADGFTATMTRAEVGRTIAVDPTIIKLGSIVTIIGLGDFIAEDTGRLIKGKRIDLLLSSVKEALEFGRQEFRVVYEPVKVI